MELISSQQQQRRNDNILTLKSAALLASWLAEQFLLQLQKNSIQDMPKKQSNMQTTSSGEMNCIFITLASKCQRILQKSNTLDNDL
jgi:hypothetical protein